MEDQKHSPLTSEEGKTSIIQKKKYPVVGAGTLVNGKYKILSQIGSGSFGTIFKAAELENDKESDHLVACKFEKRDDENIQLLVREIKVLLEIKNGNDQPLIGFPFLKFYGRDEYYNYFMMSYLGPNIESLFKKSQFQFSLLTVLRIFKQVLHRLQFLHQKNIMHRDLKPENLCIGKTKNINVIHLIDFGLSKYFKEKGQHIPMQERKGIIGTARYASINSHNGMEQSRRDDIESLCYIIVYLSKGSLPWMNLPIDKNQQKYAKIKDVKEKTAIKTLCQGLPECIWKSLEYTRNLKFDEDPKYQQIFNWIDKDYIDILTNLKINKDDIHFEWEENNNSKLKISDKSNEKKDAEEVFFKLVSKKEHQLKDQIQIGSFQVLSQNNQDNKSNLPTNNIQTSKFPNYDISDISDEESLPMYQLTKQSLIVRKPTSYRVIQITHEQRKVRSTVFKSEEIESPMKLKFSGDNIVESSDSEKESEISSIKNISIKKFMTQQHI